MKTLASFLFSEVFSFRKQLSIISASSVLKSFLSQAERVKSHKDDIGYFTSLGRSSTEHWRNVNRNLPDVVVLHIIECEKFQREICRGYYFPGIEFLHRPYNKVTVSVLLIVVRTVFYQQFRL